jgi:hypothetical protein
MVGRGQSRTASLCSSAPIDSPSPAPPHQVAPECPPPCHSSVIEQYNAALKKFYALRETLRFEQGQLTATNKALLDLHNLKWDGAPGDMAAVRLLSTKVEVFDT